MKGAISTLLLAASCLALSACVSPPVQYYTLAAPDAVRSVEPPVDFALDLLPVDMPAAIDRQSLVVRLGENELRIVDGQRWATPFSEEFQAAMSAALSRHLGTGDIGGYGSAGGRRVLRVKLQLRRLDAVFDRQVRLEADWSLRFANDASAPPRRCSARFELAAAGGYPQLVAAQQQALKLLAGLIAADARRFAAAPSGRCPAAQTVSEATPAAGQQVD